MSEQKPQCDIDDIMCQMKLMTHLSGMKEIIGSERFQEQYPDFAGLQAKVDQDLAANRESLKASLEKCDLPIPAELQDVMDEQSVKLNVRAVGGYDDS